MYERWAVLFLGVTGLALMLWGLISLPAPVALLTSGILLTGAAAGLHLRSSRAQPSAPQLPSAAAALLARLRGGASGRGDPADEGGAGKEEALAAEVPLAREEAAVQPGSTDAGGAPAGVQVHAAGAVRRADVRATATTYQEGEETATRRVRVRISGRRSP